MNSNKCWKIGLRAVLLAAVMMFHLASAARAQVYAIRFETLSVENGLSHSHVRAILQDSQGFLWFGTDEGLNKYDGYTFTIYKHDTQHPLAISSSVITAIYEDKSENLWIGTSSGLDRFDRQREEFHNFHFEPNNPLSLTGNSVSAITEDAQGNLWVGTIDGGLNRYNPENDTFDRFQFSPNNSETLVSNMVTALAADPVGGLWVGTLEGLDYYDPTANRFIHYQYDVDFPNSLSDNQVIKLYVDRTGTLWVGTETGGLNRFDRANKNFTSYRSWAGNAASLISDNVSAILEDRRGRLWVGGRNGLHIMERGENTFTRFQHDPNDPYSLGNDNVLAIHEDRSGVIWVGTGGSGLSKYNQTNERFNLYQHYPGIKNSLSDNIVQAIFENRQGDAAWIGTMDGGLNLLSLETGNIVVFQNNPPDLVSLSSNDVRAIYEDGKGNLWIGTYGGGLNRYDRGTGRFKRFRYSVQDRRSLNDDRVMAILEDRRGNLWVGTRGGLNLMTNRQLGQFIHYQHDPADPASLSDNFVRVLYEDRRGKLWVGTNSGISVLDLDTMRFLRYKNNPDDPNSLSNDRVLSIYETPDGTIWVGTQLGGLNRLDRNTTGFVQYTEKQGLANDTVNGILGDRDGYLWLSTNQGLSRFDPKTETFRNYDVRDGLQSNEFNVGAAHQGVGGRMYFGGVQGLNVFNPDEVKDNPIAPPVVITAFIKFNQVERKDLRDGDQISLSYQDNFISFEFAALDYSTPEKNQYAYKLEGFDKDWVHAGTRRYASYTNLKGGEYIFRVKGSNKDGVWNETGSSIQIIVIPPIWERWWFIGTAALMAGVVVAGGYFMRTRRIRLEKRMLEEQVRERTQEIERRQLVAEGLREILAILNSNRTLRESLDRIIQQAVRLTGARAMVIFRSGEGSLPVAVASNLPENVMLIEPLTGSNGGQKLARRASLLFMPEWINQVLEKGEPLMIPDLQEFCRAHAGLAQHRLLEFGSLLAVPLLMNDVIDGGLVLVYDRPNAMKEDGLHTAQSFADHAALAIANARLRVQAEEQAVSAERSRLARDLHDAVTQTLFATSLIAEVLPRLWDRNPEIGKQKVNEIRELTRGALVEMRTLLMELRPAALDDVTLADLLQQLSEAFTGRARVPVTLEADKAIHLPPNVKIGFYRIAQEALNNIAKHARASQVNIHLSQNPQQVTLVISDDGIGFDPQTSSPDHFGLSIMEERAQSIGGCFEIISSPGRGTKVSMCWDITQLD